jgi:hypothetical protein
MNNPLDLSQLGAFRDGSGYLLTDEERSWYVLLLQRFHPSLGNLPKLKRPASRKISEEKSYTLVY